MKAFGFLAAMLLLNAPALAAQTSLSAPMDPRLIVVPAQAAPAPARVEMRRDHLRGALDGLVIGGALGAVGFAAVTYFTESGADGEGYWLLALPVGAVAGGAVGLVTGAIIGAPEREPDDRP